MIDGMATKGNGVKIPENLQQQALKQLHVNHMGIEKKNRLYPENKYNVVSMNSHIEGAFKMCTLHLGYQQMQPIDKIIPHRVLGKP